MRREWFTDRMIRSGATARSTTSRAAGSAPAGTSPSITYRDPENDSFGAMRVFNDDRLIPGAVWPLHPHRDVEGLTYVVEGTFGHEDNVGGAFGPLPAGSVQRMTLGLGRAALGAERLEDRADAVHPDLDPARHRWPRAGVEQRVFTTEDRTNRLLKVIAPIVSGAVGGEAASPGGDLGGWVEVRTTTVPPPRPSTVRSPRRRRPARPSGSIRTPPSTSPRSNAASPSATRSATAAAPTSTSSTAWQRSTGRYSRRAPRPRCGSSPASRSPHATPPS